MDFGVVGLEGGTPATAGLVCAETTGLPSSPLPSDARTKQKWYGSSFLKQERSPVIATEEDWRELKVAKTSDDFSASKTMLLQQSTHPLLRSSSANLLSEGQNMLSFSSPNSQTVTLPYFHQTSSAYSRNAGYGSAGLNAGSMHGVLTGVRGPFTPSQWMELEHQALIYKYITANVPIPSYLLNPIRKALDSAGFSSFSGLRPNTLGWGAFHLGFSNNTDPEPGRCRRTDGKKWRCSRDAVADQKYCERHMNRGRHRSRKPVEGQTGHSVSGTTNNDAKLMPAASSTSATLVPGGGPSNSLGLTHQLNSLQPASNNPSSESPHLDRSFVDKENVVNRYQDTGGLSVISSTIGLKENQYFVTKQQNLYEESSRMEFGLVCSDSLLNPLNRSSSLVNSRDYDPSEDLNNNETKSRHPLHLFMDDWPKNQPGRSIVSWPDIDLRSDRTQLSISTPVSTSDLMSSTASPNHEKLAASPLRLSRELESTHMGLGVGAIGGEQNQRQGNWIPVSWQSSMGGPLGEVLNSTNSSTGDCKNTSALNLMTEGWDSSPRMASSPTGVLQKAAFGSLSNSSAGSSPRAENSKSLEGASLCNGLLGSTLMNPSLPAL